MSDDLVLQENGNNETNVRNKMRDYLGIDPYHITIDPQGDYIAHVDCWGKYLAPDKILIAQVPTSNSHYADYESVANYFATTNCCWGYPYHVYRVFEPGGNTLAPYTNSLILNKTVYVPLGTNNTYNNDALAVYQEAMPGYTIVGVTNNDWSTSWENTDALHCRTRGIMDFDMLFVDHREVLFGEQEWQESFPVVSKFIAYSGADLKQDSLLVYYSIDGGAYQVAHMTATGNPDEYVGYITGYQGGSEINYYVFGADESGHRYTQPVFADLDPHHFTVGEHQPTGEFIVTPDTLYFENNEIQSISLINETNEAVVISAMNQPDNTAVYANIWYEGQIIGNVLPLTIQPGQTIQVGVNFVEPPYPSKINYSSYIEIVSSAGNRRVDLVISDSIWGGLLSFEDIWLENFEPVSETVFNYYLSPVVINEIYEHETDYLIIENDPLPISVPSLSSFSFKVRVRENKEEYLDTKIVLSTDHGDVFITVHINDNLLSVTELSAEAKLYPNPTTGFFTVEGANVSKVEVYNLVGQKVHEAEGKTVNINATEWNKGIYLVNIIEENGAVVAKKLVVK